MERNFTLYRKLFTSTFYLSAFTFGGGYVDVYKRQVYETDVIRINSQSGKGGVGYMLEEYYGYELPNDMREEVGRCV